MSKQMFVAILDRDDRSHDVYSLHYQAIDRILELLPDECADAVPAFSDYEHVYTLHHEWNSWPPHAYSRTEFLEQLGALVAGIEQHEDQQVDSRGRTFSATDTIEELEAVREDVEQTEGENRFYVYLLYAGL